MSDKAIGPVGYNPIRGNQVPDASEKIAQLKADFENNQSTTRMQSAKALAQLGKRNESILNFFLDHSASPHDTTTRQIALHGLFELGHITGIYKITSSLSDDNSDVRNYVIALLCSGSTGNTHPAVWGSRAFDSALKLLDDKDPTIRGNAAMLLGTIKDPRAGKQLAEKLEGEEQYVRHRIAYALGEIGTTGALKALMGALNNNIGDREFEQIAREAIAKIKPSPGFSLPYATLHGLPENSGSSRDPYTGAEYLSGEEDYQRRLQEQDDEYQRQLRAREEEEYQQRLREEEENRRRQEEEQALLNSFFAINPDDIFGLG